ADAGGCVLDTSNHRAGQQQDAQDALSDVSLSAQGFLSLASHNVYYVKLNAMLEARMIQS
ncbi:hypothetical protein, partial [Pseudomonas aeruginosa]|uniref:hypothetical protein n=1 Tax=Pseudomonas aeruginosa TaxID=287 RepID=UPI001EE496D9